MKIINIILLLTFSVIVVIDRFFPEVVIEHSFEVQAPIEKAFENITSKAFTEQLYDVALNSLNVEVGTIDTITSNKGDSIILSWDEVSPPFSIVKNVSTSDWQSKQNIQLQDKKKVTQFTVLERIIAKGLGQRFLFHLFKSKLTRKRRGVMNKWKTIIESTPDFHFLPSMQK